MRYAKKLKLNFLNALSKIKNAKKYDMAPQYQVITEKLSKPLVDFINDVLILFKEFSMKFLM
jgi:hypothetical protein